MEHLLPNAKNADAPHMSQEIFDYHCGMHQLAYVINLNKLNKGSEYERASLETIIKELNPLLKGWFGYFRHAHRSTFRDVDGFVRRRLRALLRKREKRPGFGRTAHDHHRWPNAFFAAHGLFTLHEAHALASRPR